jgi:acyl carrier protein
MPLAVKMNPELLAKIVGAIRKVKTVNKEISDDSLLVADLNFESIDVVDLIFELEEATGCRISMVEFNQHMFANMQGTSRDVTVAQIKQFLEAKTK